MSIKRKLRLMSVFAGVLVGITLGGAMVGCGSGTPLGGGSTNNDQGTSFLAFGYFPAGSALGSQQVGGATLPLANDSNTGTNLDQTPTTSGLTGRELILQMGLQNRLRSQFIRVARIDCDYVVPGADPSLVIPSDSFNGGTVIAASALASVPPGGPAAGTGSLAQTPFTVVSSDIYSFLNVNRNYLPQLPFRMIATCRAIGISQAGDVFVSNDLPFQIFFNDAAECCTGEVGEPFNFLGGFQNGPGTGGTPIGIPDDEDTATTPTPTPTETPTPGL